MASLSVIIPIYKVEQYLRQCLDSVVNQTFKDLEIILIDDGSPDNCGVICDEYASNDERITVIHKSNGGLPEARNDALKIATGDYVAFVDSDDWLELDIYEKAISAIVKYDVDVLFFNSFRNTEKQEIKISLFDNEFVLNDTEKIKRLQGGAMCQFLTETKELGYGYPWDRIFKRTFIEENHLVFRNVKAYEDILYAIDTFQYANSIAFISARGYHYRFNPTSIGNRYMQNRKEVDRSVWEIILQLGKDYNVHSTYYDGMNALIVTSLSNLLQRCIFHSENTMSMKEKRNKLRKIVNSEPYNTALCHVKRCLLTKATKPIAIFRTHCIPYLYVLYGMRVMKRK